ncbi:MAG: PPOX class F420-dependent oxidoreductase [Actinobacteria bacterium]|nr:PPOX class F420-dependent oxidoreductase [Actinomycetota bacterium]
MGIAEARYIRFTNFRRSGDAVSTPVWIAPFGDEFVFSTHPDAGKVKRLRNDPRVEVAACDMRGNVSSGTNVVTGTARLLADDEHAAADAVMKRKYGIQWSMLGLGQSVRRLLGRDPGRTFIAITLGDTVRTEP